MSGVEQAYVHVFEPVQVPAVLGGPLVHSLLAQQLLAPVGMQAPLEHDLNPDVGHAHTPAPLHF